MRCCRLPNSGRIGGEEGVERGRGVREGIEDVVEGEVNEC